ncbi:MAG: O-antigen ligase family protein [Smithella sp.]
MNNEPDNTGPRAQFKEFNWVPIVYLYVVYFGIIFVGGVTNAHTNFIGASVLLVFLFIKYWRYLFSRKIDMLLFCITFSMILPVIPMISYDSKTFLGTAQELVKYYALGFVILIGTSLPLTPINRCKKNWLLYVVVLSFLIVGWVWPGGRDIYQGRVKGFLPNPNGFSLTAMVLLFLVDDRRSRTLIRKINNVIVIILIYISRTSGAILGYACGLAHRYLFLKNSKFSFVRFLTLMLGLTLTTIIFLWLPQNTFKPIDVIIRKLAIAQEHSSKVFSNRQINYHEIIQKEKENVTSGLWRFYHWHKIMGDYLNSSFDKILFGHGIGTTDILFKMKAHNDYLRLLFEIGLIGLFFNIVTWVLLYRRMDLKYRWIVIMVAFFCITENNYDHFPAMSLLVFYMIGANKDAIVQLQ